MEIIEIQNLTKDYGKGKGIFDVNISVKKGEVFGFLGPNGAGKTTTIRNLLGFITPDKGQCSIHGMNCFTYAATLQKSMGYLAGEISFFDDMNGKQLIDFIAAMKGVTDKSRIIELMDRFELDPRGRIKKMSKGMKQKLGIICAFMNNPDIIILDEPTSGLDPLMQNRFIDLVLEEKAKGKTIFMSSHIFEEVERTCDRTAIIKQGRIVAIENMTTLNEKKRKSYVITFIDNASANQFQAEQHNINIIETKGNQVTVFIQGEIQPFLKTITNYSIKDLDIKTPSLEEVFIHYYGGESK